MRLLIRGWKNLDFAHYTATKLGALRSIYLLVMPKHLHMDGVPQSGRFFVYFGVWD